MPSSAPAWSRAHVGALVGVLLAALALRGGALAAAPRHAYLWDHVTFMAWSDWAYERGPTAVYEFPPGWPIPVERPAADVVVTLPVRLSCNYPPFAGVLFWVQGWLWQRLDPRPLRPGPIRAPVEAPSRATNTVAARVAGSALGVVADLVMAWGVACLVGLLAGRMRARGREIGVFAIVALAPPVVLDSAFFGQTDSWLMALIVWALWAALRGRPLVAGALYGVALMTKAQAVIFAPVLAGLYAAPLVAGARAGGWRAARGAAIGVAVAVLTIAAPFSLAGRADPAAGSLTWLERAYVSPILSEYPFTTMKAFNVWRLAATLAAPGDRHDARTTTRGVSRDTVGRVLLLLGLGASLAFCARRWGTGPSTWVAFAFLAALSAFVLPTRVKARYIYYCLPFGVAMAERFPPWRLPVAGVLVVATLEIGWVLWYEPASMVTRLVSVGAAAAMVGTYAFVLAVLLRPASPGRDGASV